MKEDHMKTRSIVPVVLGVAMLSTPVLAAGNYAAPTTKANPQVAMAMSQSEKCTALQKQFDEAIKMHESAAKVADAKMMRADGAKLCASGKHSEGITKLETALKDIGVTPKS
jgi:hypothetical protein